MNKTKGLDLDQTLSTSDAFIGFIQVAKDMVHRLQEDRINFFEGEEDVMKILDVFMEQGIIQENEYYEFLDHPFEISVYKLLKKLYFNGFFSGNIYIVEDIHDILIALGKLLKSQEIDEIREYFRVRFEALMEKERRHLLPHLVENILDSLLYATLREDQKNIWEMLVIANSYDTTDFIQTLFGHANSLGIVTHEGLHFLYINGFLSENEALQERVYITLMDFYAFRRPSTPIRVQELQEYRDRLKQSNATNIPDIGDTEKYRNNLKNYIRRQSEGIFSQVRFGKYDEKAEQAFKAFLSFLHAENIIDDIMYHTCQEGIGDVSSVFYILQTLAQAGYLDHNPRLKTSIDEADAMYQSLLEEEDIPEEDDISLTASIEEIDSHIISCTKTIFLLIESQLEKELENFLYDFINFLLENKVFDDETVAGITASDTFELSSLYVQKLNKNGYYVDTPKLQRRVNTFLDTHIPHE